MIEARRRLKNDPETWSQSPSIQHWLLIKVLHPTRHKTGHFGDVPQANLLVWYGKTKLNTTKGHIHQSKEMYIQHRINTKKLKPCLVASYDIRPGNGVGLFWLRCFINVSLTYLLRHSLTYSPGPHGAVHATITVLNVCS